MKLNFYKITAILTLLCCNLLLAQINPDLEMTSAGGDVTNGPATTTTVNLYKNTDNPTGSTYNTYNIAAGQNVTMSLQNFTPAYQGTTISGGNSVSIGQTGALAGPKYGPFVSGAPSNNFFTSSTSAAGTGLIVDGTAATNNYGVIIKAYTAKLNDAGVANNARVKLAELKVVFSRPVNNPVFQITGLGGQGGASLGFSSEFTLNTILSDNTISGITKLSGNTALVINGFQINNGATAITATGAGMAAGSVRINGTNITTIVFDVYMRGDGGGTAASYGTGNAATTGDAFALAFTTSESDLQVSKTVDNVSPLAGNNVVFTVTAKNNGASNNTAVTVNDLLPSGFTYVSHTASNGNGTYIPGTGVWTIGAFDDQAIATLSVTATAKISGNYNNTAIIGTTSGIFDPISTNNTSSATATAVCYNSANTATAGVDSRHGITLLSRAGAVNGNWPMIRKSAHTVLESNSKGFVITRATTAQINSIVSPQEGMMVYDTDLKCLKINSNGTNGGWSCFNTPSCP